MRRNLTRKDVDALTREEWRELGFFYEYDDASASWRFVGSRDGLLKFCALLEEYVAEPRNTKLSEHEHYGPYMYLKIITSTEPRISKTDISGTIGNIQSLADLLRSKLRNPAVGDTFDIDEEYSSDNESRLHFEVRDDGFDPASADPLL